MIISENYGMLYSVCNRLYTDRTIAEPEIKTQSLQTEQQSGQQLAPISNGVEASEALRLQDGKPQIGITSRLEELDVEKEMNEVQKDKAIEQYQYFIQDKYHNEDHFFQMIMKY